MYSDQTLSQRKAKSESEVTQCTHTDKLPG